MGWLNELIQRSIDAIDKFKGKTNTLLKTWSFNLNSAGNQTISISGNFIYVVEATDGSANIDVQFSRKDADIDVYNLVKGLGLIHPFDKLHISWNAQANKTLNIWIGNLAPELLNVIDNRGAVTQETLLTAIRDELQGDIDEENWDTEKTIGTSQSQVLASNSNRKCLLVQAKSTNTGIIYIGFDNTVTSTKWVAELQAGQSLMMDDYRGEIRAIATASGQKLGWGEW